MKTYNVIVKIKGNLIDDLEVPNCKDIKECIDRVYKMSDECDIIKIEKQEN